MSTGKGRLKKALPPIMSNNGSLVLTGEEKAEILHNIFASVFTGSLSPHPTAVDGPQDRDQRSKALPCNGRPGSEAPEEPQHTRVYGN